jgi:dCTP deaminase
VLLTDEAPFVLEPGQFVLGSTLEKVTFPRKIGRPAYSGRVEGKSSRARFGLAVHITAPTIHNDFSGTVTLEIMNFGQSSIYLHPGVYICQLIVEQLDAVPFSAPNQFSGQKSPIG